MSRTLGPMTPEPDRAALEPPARRRDLVVLLVALAVAVVLVRITGALTLRGAVPWPVLRVVLDDAAVWFPLACGIVWVLRGFGSGLLVRLRVELGDLVFALGIVILARVVDAAVGLTLTGTTGLVPAPSLGAPDVGLLLVSAIGIVLVSPVLEEVFFRGLFQRLLAAELTPGTRWLAVVLTAVVFAFAHLFLGAFAMTLGGLQVFVTTFVLGAMTGSLVAVTGRIGGAVVAHVLFNAVAVVIAWPR